MLEQVYHLTQNAEKVVEKIIQDENLHLAHIVLPKGDVVPSHNTNSTVYMTVVRGTLSIALGDQEVANYEMGTVLKIPFDTKMQVSNQHLATLELIVVKAPAPHL